MLISLFPSTQIFQVPGVRAQQRETHMHHVNMATNLGRKQGSHNFDPWLSHNLCCVDSWCWLCDDVDAHAERQRGVCGLASVSTFPTCDHASAVP